jgi:hypothetical protein
MTTDDRRAWEASLQTLSETELQAEAMLRIRAYRECREGPDRSYRFQLAGSVWAECLRRDRAPLFRRALNRIAAEAEANRRINDLSPPEKGETP